MYRCRPPPHWHEQEDEVFYVVEGHMEAHCGDQVFQVHAGESLFLPKRKPHGFIVRSPRLRAMCVIQPSGAERSLRSLGRPKNLGGRLPLGSADGPAIEILDNTVDVAARFGVHTLTRDEIVSSRERVSDSMRLRPAS
jgi:hypothetical protein